LSFEISNIRYASKTGSRLFVPINKLNRWNRELPVLNKKPNDRIDLKYSFKEENHTIIEIPDGFNVEAIPKSIELNTDFSTYYLKVKKDGKNKIEISRVLEMTKRRLPAENYDELREFNQAVEEYDSKNIVLRSL